MARGGTTTGEIALYGLLSDSGQQVWWRPGKVTPQNLLRQCMDHE